MDIEQPYFDDVSEATSVLWLLALSWSGSGVLPAPGRGGSTGDWYG